MRVKRNVINLIFDLVANSLVFASRLFKTTYNAINIIVYYMLVPLSWTLLTDNLIGGWYATAILLGIWIGIIITSWGQFLRWCDYAFYKSVNFLLWFKRFGWNYYVSSVIICVFVPIFIYGILIWLNLYK